MSSQSGHIDLLRSASRARAPTVAILLATFNGECYLAEQLESIAAQTHGQWAVFASDDGSEDRTLEMLQEYRARWGDDRLHIFSGPRRGFSANFMSLVRRPEINADYISFCDQDDIWFRDKLERSLAKMMGVGSATPGLFCSRARLVSADGQVIGLTPPARKAPSFRNALVQSLAGANTMLLNKAALALLRGVPEGLPVSSHDWLAYLLISGCGGVVVYEPEPTIDYRLHDGNVVGANASWLDRLKRMRRGNFRRAIEQNLAALQCSINMLSPSSIEVLEMFQRARGGNALQCVHLLRKSGVYRQSLAEDVALMLAAIVREV